MAGNILFLFLFLAKRLAGIVLTIVAGLFYSSSVIESLSNANFYRAISTSALVGVVCFDLIALMFSYIERIKNSDTVNEKASGKKNTSDEKVSDKKNTEVQSNTGEGNSAVKDDLLKNGKLESNTPELPFFGKTTKAINIVLISIMIVFAIAQEVIPQKSNDGDDFNTNPTTSVESLRIDANVKIEASTAEEETKQIETSTLVETTVTETTIETETLESATE